MTNDRKMVTPQNIFKAYKNIKSQIRHTPLEFSKDLSELVGTDIFLKLENLQITGSFKSRISFNRLLLMSEKEKKAGVIAPTAGNHGIGLSSAAKNLNVPATIFLPEKTDPAKIKTLKQFGPKIEYFNSMEEARLQAIHYSKQKNLTFISAYNDPAVIAGDGTVGLEILLDMSDVNTVIVNIGGGGLISGIGTIMKAVNPEIQIIGVQPDNSPTLAKWFKHKKVVAVDLKPSIAEGLSGEIEPDTITFPHILNVVDRIITVSEEKIIDGMKWLLEHHGHIIEPSGAASVAALLNSGREFMGNKVVAIITGANISHQRFKNLTGS